MGSNEGVNCAADAQETSGQVKVGLARSSVRALPQQHAGLFLWKSWHLTN